MSKLKKIRESLNLTQEELSEKSGISVRTIQRIESGTDPKGQTRKILARYLNVNENELLEGHEPRNEFSPSLIKIINLSSLPFTFIPLANILLPLIIMFIKKEFSPLAKQLVSVQILWTICAFIIFMFASFMKNWFDLNRHLILVVMILLVLSNVFIILRNAAEIDRKRKLFFRLGFNVI